MLHFIQLVAWPVGRWAEGSQQQACRNAMVASTELAAGRRERDEVQELVTQLLTHRRPRTGADTPALPVARLG